MPPRWCTAGGAAVSAQVLLQVPFSAAYVLGCAFRSVLPVYDIPRRVLVDSPLSSRSGGPLRCEHRGLRLGAPVRSLRRHGIGPVWRNSIDRCRGRLLARIVSSARRRKPLTARVGPTHSLPASTPASSSSTRISVWKIPLVALTHYPGFATKISAKLSHSLSEPIWQFLELPPYSHSIVSSARKHLNRITISDRCWSFSVRSTVRKFCSVPIDGDRCRKIPFDHIAGFTTIR